MTARRANAERGEHELTLGGKTYPLRPTHAALVAIEKMAGAALLALVRLGNAGQLTLGQLGAIGGELIRAGATTELGRAVDDERIGELIFEEGVPVVTAKLTLCLLDAATGGRTTSGEAKAAPAAKGRAGAA